MIFVLSFTIPVLSHIPTERTTLLKRLNAACTRFSQELIARTKAEEHLDEGSEQTGKGDKSAMALLSMLRSWSLSGPGLMGADDSQGGEGGLGVVALRG